MVSSMFNGCFLQFPVKSLSSVTLTTSDTCLQPFRNRLCSQTL